MDRFRVFHVFPVNSWSFPISCPFYRIERQLYCIELIFYIITGIYPSLLSVILLHEISQSVIWCSGSPPCCFCIYIPPLWNIWRGTQFLPNTQWTRYCDVFHIYLTDQYQVLLEHIWYAGSSKHLNIF